MDQFYLSVVVSKGTFIPFLELFLCTFDFCWETKLLRAIFLNHAFLTISLLSSDLVHMASNLNGLLFAVASNQSLKTIGLWYEWLAGRCLTPALGKTVLHNSFARALSNLYLICARPSLLFLLVYGFPTKPRSTHPECSIWY